MPKKTEQKSQSRTFAFGSESCTIPVVISEDGKETISAGLRKRVDGVKFGALYEKPEFAERAKKFDFTTPTKASAEFAALTMEYNLRYPDEAELLVLEAILTPSNGKTVKELYYESATKEQVEAVLDFFEPSVPDKTEE